MGFIDDFKAFAVKGNVIDLAVAVVIGGAFGKIVTSLVNDIIMPPIGYAMKGIEFSQLAWTIGINGKGEAVTINYGSFIQISLNFLIIAMVIFIVVRQFQKLKRKPEALPPTTRECPYCAEVIQKKATKCCHCTADVAAEV